MKKIFLILMAVFMISSIAYGAGSDISWDVSDGPVMPNGTWIFTATCTADDTDGSFPSTVETPVPIDGIITRVKTVPGTSPTALYDIVINDEDGDDVMEGELADRSATLPESVRTAMFVDGKVKVVITNNLVNSATVVIDIYVLR